MRNYALSFTPHLCFSLGCALLRYQWPTINTLLGTAMITGVRGLLTAIELNPVPRDDDDLDNGTGLYFWGQALASYLAGNFSSPVTEALKLFISTYFYHVEGREELRLSHGLAVLEEQRRRLLGLA